MNLRRLMDDMLLMTRAREADCKSLLAEYHLRASDLDVLIFLATHPDVHTAQAICGSRLIAKSLVSASVETLVSRGLLTRAIDPDDRRRTLLTLTPAADAITQRCIQSADAFMQRACEGISTGDLQTFERVLRQMRHNMNMTDAAE